MCWVSYKKAMRFKRITHFQAATCQYAVVFFFSRLYYAPHISLVLYFNLMLIV